MTHGKSEATYICLPFISILFGFKKGLNRFQGRTINKIHKTQIQIHKSIMAYDLKIDLITGLWKSLIGQLQLSKNLLEEYTYVQR